MNVKIKADSVTALFPNNGSLSYDMLYKTLSTNIPSEAFLFSRRTPGSGFLQWDLPGEGWTPLSKVDPLVENMVVAEKERLFNVVMAAFSTNAQLAQKVLTVPDDNYIFYRATDNGEIEVKLTAWGYKYPIRIDNPWIDVDNTPKKEKQEVAVSFTYDGAPLSGYKFLVDGFKRVTDSNGSLLLGTLPVGNTYTIDTPDGHHAQIVIAKGQRDYVIDVTAYVALSVLVNRDGMPAAGVACKITYWGHTATITTDSNGTAATSLPLDRDLGDCCVTAEDQSQQKPLLLNGANQFTFNLVTPVAPDPIPDEDDSAEPDEHEEPDNDDGKTPDTDDEKADPDTADDSNNDTGEIGEGDNNDSGPADVEITIRVEDENGAPMAGATMALTQDGQPTRTVILDANGTTTLKQSDFVTKQPLSASITVEGQTLKPVVFELEDGETEYLLRAVMRGGNSRLLEVLVALGLLAACAATLFGIIKILL